MKRIKAILATIGVLSFALLPAVGFAQVALGEPLGGTGKVTCGVENSTTMNADCAAEEGTTNVQSIVKTVINIFSWVVGVVSVIMIIVAGFKYVTSGGNDSSVASAKNTILYAIVGLVIVALAQVIVRFVLKNLAGDGAAAG